MVSPSGNWKNGSRKCQIRWRMRIYKPHIFLESMLIFRGVIRTNKNTMQCWRERERWWNSGTESHFCLRDFIPQWMLNNKLKLKLCTPKCIILNLNFDGLGSFAKISYVCWEQNVHPFLCGPCGRHIIPNGTVATRPFLNLLKSCLVQMRFSFPCLACNTPET